jgi:hypothetical protein
MNLEKEVNHQEHQEHQETTDGVWSLDVTRQVNALE